MAKHIFDGDIDLLNRTVAATPINNFAVPHMVVDDLFTAGLIEKINANWPRPEDFQPEVPGNNIIHLYRKDYDRITDVRQEFWRSFNEDLWPSLVSAAAMAVSGPAEKVFGDLYYEKLEIDMPLTLMQADENYAGHGEHTHFHHAPHWAFTMLMYVDPEESISNGTALWRLVHRDFPDVGETSYSADDLDWRTDVAMDLYGKNRDGLGADFEEREYEYRCNRLFVFMDGPLALHSVPYDREDRTANPDRALDNGRNARRRILRSHVKVHHAPFYERHSQMLPEPLDPTRYMRVCDPSIDLTDEDVRYRSEVIRPFYRERLQAYAKATANESGSIAPSAISRYWPFKRKSTGYDNVKLTNQLTERLP